jgi:hypothetical protein
LGFTQAIRGPHFYLHSCVAGTVGKN